MQRTNDRLKQYPTRQELLEAFANGVSFKRIVAAVYRNQKRSFEAYLAKTADVASWDEYLKENN